MIQTNNLKTLSGSGAVHCTVQPESPFLLGGVQREN